MNKKFKEKLEIGILYEDLEELYMKICNWHANIGFLHNYCYAYANLEGIYYFIPYTDDLKKAIVEIGEDLEKIIGHTGNIRKKDKCITNVNSKFIEPLIKLN